jgi:hypothetical protein
VDAPAEFVELSWKTLEKVLPPKPDLQTKIVVLKPGSFVVSQMALETTTPAPEAVGNPRSCCSGLLARGGPSWEAKAARLNRLTNPRETDSDTLPGSRFGWASLILPGALIACCQNARLPRRLRRAGHRPIFHSRRLQLEDRAARLAAVLLSGWLCRTTRLISERAI